MGFKLRREPVVRLIRLCDDQNARCVFVDTVDNSGPLFTAHTGQAFPAVVHQRIDQRARRRAWRGVYYHACRLVDHNQIIIFKDHIQRNVFWQHMAFGGFGHSDAYLHPLGRTCLDVCHDSPVHLNRALCDQFSKPRA